MSPVTKQNARMPMMTARDQMRLSLALGMLLNTTMASTASHEAHTTCASQLFYGSWLPQQAMHQMDVATAGHADRLGKDHLLHGQCCRTLQAQSIPDRRASRAVARTCTGVCRFTALRDDTAQLTVLATMHHEQYWESRARLSLSEQ